MSCPITKARKSKLKDARQSSAPDKPSTGNAKKSKKSHSYIVEGLMRVGFLAPRRWRKWGAYATCDIAEKALAKFERSYGGVCEFRLRILETA